MNRDEYIFQEDLVSIVTPVYNGEFHLPAMLDSVLAQTYPKIELILTDDGSDDRTIAVAESYREKFDDRGYGYRIVPGEHRNASAAINRGLPYVTGEYLIWPDSDDLLDPESVMKRVDFLRKHREYHCVRSLACYFDAATGEISDKRDEKQGDLSKEDLFWDILESRTYVCCGCYMLKAQSFFEIYPQRQIPEYDVGQNFQMLLPFMFRHKCPTIQEVLYKVAIREGSHSRRKLTQAEEEKKYRDYEDLIDDIARICPIEDQPSKERIICWKERRRYNISLKYGHIRQALASMRKLNKYGETKKRISFKEIIWLCFVNGWVEEKIYPIYRKIFNRKQFEE